MSSTPSGGPESQFEAFLRSVPPETPDPVARELARASFLEHASRPEDPSRMGHSMESREPRGARPTDADLERWLRERAPLAAPRPEVRERARRRFLTEALTGPEALPAAAGDHPDASGWRKWGVLALAAAAVVAVTLILPEPLRWKARMDGPVRFAGTTYGAGDAGRLGADLEQAGLIESAEEEVLLVLGGALELSVRPRTRLQLPPLPQLDGLTPVDLDLEQGEVYVRTREAYPGNPIQVTTPEGRVEVLGTTLGVMAESDGTCVCVAEGKVTVISPLLDRGVEEVSTGRALFLYRDLQQESQLMRFEDMPAGGGAHVGDLVTFLGR